MATHLLFMSILTNASTETGNSKQTYLIGGIVLLAWLVLRSLKSKGSHPEQTPDQEFPEADVETPSRWARFWGAVRLIGLLALFGWTVWINWKIAVVIVGILVTSKIRKAWRNRQPEPDEEEEPRPPSRLWRVIKTIALAAFFAWLIWKNPIAVAVIIALYLGWKLLAALMEAQRAVSRTVSWIGLTLKVTLLLLLILLTMLRWNWEKLSPEFQKTVQTHSRTVLSTLGAKLETDEDLGELVEVNLTNSTDRDLVVWSMENRVGTVSAGQTTTSLRVPRNVSLSFQPTVPLPAGTAIANMMIAEGGEPQAIQTQAADEDSDDDDDDGGWILGLVPLGVAAILGGPIIATGAVNAGYFTNKITTLRNSIQNPTGAINQPWYQGRQGELRSIERKLHRWMRNRGHRSTEQQRIRMTNHLNDLEDIHGELVRLQLENDLSLSLPRVVNQADRGLAEQIWNAVRNNNGRIKIEGSEAFRLDILGDIAKLLQSDQGRQLLNQLNRGDHDVRLSDNWNNLDNHRAGSWAYPMSDGPHQATYLDGQPRPSPGTGSYVQIDRANREMMTGEHGDASIAMPSYLTLGHELGHALANQSGLAAESSSVNMAWELISQHPADPHSLWTSAEEFRNITQVENVLRDHHGLPRRKFHRPPQTVRWTRRYYHLLERFGQAQNAYQNVAKLEEVDFELGQLQITFYENSSNFEVLEQAVTRATQYLDALPRPSWLKRLRTQGCCR